MPAADPSGPRPVRAPRGTALSCRGWPQEAAMRMLMNNLDPEVAEHPDQLIVYGGSGRAARSWPAYDAIVRTLQDLQGDETLLVQSGKPVGVMRTHEWAPRVLIANSNLVPQWATWEEFRRLESLGLTMYGQMTAGSWIYIGTQGILQGTYETFAAVAAKRFGGSLAGTITLTAGLGGMGGAQPLAVTMNGGVAIVIDCDPSRIARRIEYGYLDEAADDVDDALRRATAARDAGEPLSIGLLGNAAELLPRMLAMGAPIDVVTDQTSAHDPLTYLPRGVAFEDMAALRAEDPAGFTERARQSMAAHVEAMVGFMDAGAEVFDYGNSIRGEAAAGRATPARSTSPASCPPTSGRCSARAGGRSGGPRCPGTRPTSPPPTRPSSTCSPTTSRWPGGSGWPRRRCTSRASRRGSAGSATASGTWPGSGSTSWSRAATSRPPSCSAGTTSTAGRWPRPTGRPRRMADGSDAIADWPLLNALVNTASGASWVSIHHGGGVGIGRSIHAGQVCVADGTPLAGEKLERVLTNDPGMGVIRHVDAGYEEAAEVAAAAGRARPDAAVMSTPVRRATFAALWESLLPVGRDPGTGGYRRFSWTPADLDCRAWFEAAARDRQLRTGPDRNGNLWAWWDVPGSARLGPAREPTGSHLDSVPDGGAYDGPLGVVSAFAAIDELRAEGFTPSRPDRGGRVHRGGRGPLRGRLPGQPPADRRDRPRGGPGAARRRRDHAGRRDAGGRAGSRPDRPRRGPARAARLLRGAAHRAGPGPGRPRRRPGHRRGDLAARPVAARLRRAG